jgi:hypothetical protein
VARKRFDARETKQERRRHDLSGQVVQEHRAYGAVHYAKPPAPGHYHIIAGDPRGVKIVDRTEYRFEWKQQ